MTDIPYEPGLRYRSGRDALTDSEIALVLRACTTAKDYALIGLTIATGMRREDVVNVEQAHIREIPPEETGANGFVIGIVYWEHKRRRMWRAYVAGQIAQFCVQFMNSHPKSRWLFPSPFSEKRHISSRHAYDLFQRALKKAGLRPRPFHALRATCIKQCQRRGWTIEQTMELTGDSWRTIQEHYLTPSEDELRETAISKPLVGTPLMKLVAQAAKEKSM